MEEYDIKKDLKRGIKAAKKGYKLTIKQYKNLKKTIDISGKEIKKSIKRVNESSCYISKATQALCEQMKETYSRLDNLTIEIKEDVESLNEQISNFTISLFGRTGAGKSTLMETLTYGDGSTIGKGAQRTTRDKREYKWNGITIWDVPGIGAVNGEEDTRIALEVAKQADLIVFLITSNAPQLEEAKYFAQLIELGKPVICVINVRIALKVTDSQERKVNKIKKALDKEELSELISQFKEYASLDGEIWEDIEFVPVHLNAAYISQREQNVEFAKELEKESHILKLKEIIIYHVMKYGEYYREKKFLDIISNETIDMFENLLHESYLNEKLSKEIEYKRLQLANWGQNYRESEKKKMKSLLSGVVNDLKEEIPDFVEKHYEDKKVKEAWGRIVVSKGIDSRCEDYLNNIQQQITGKFEDLKRSVINELKYIEYIYNESNYNIPKMHRIIDTKRAWNWGTKLVEAGLMVGMMFCIGLASSTPVAWLAILLPAILSKIGSLFLSREKKIEKAKKKLNESLENNISEARNTLESNLKRESNKIMNGLYIQEDELNQLSEVFKSLSDKQRELAIGLKPVLLKQGKQVFSLMLKLISRKNNARRIKEAARIPGKLLLVNMKKGKEIENESLRIIESILLEYLIISKDNDEENSEEKTILDLLFKDEKYVCQDDGNYKVIHFERVNNDIKNRVRIAQQFLGTYIELNYEKESEYA